jgi:hypothetical protein
LLLFKVFGLRAWIPNALLVAMGTLMTYIVLAISKKVISGWVAYLPALMFPTLAMRAGLDGTHHWYSSLCSMAAILVVTKKRNPTRLLFAGALCGVAAFFTQSRGAVAALGLAAFLLWEAGQEKQRWGELLRREVCLLGSFAGTLAVALDYFIWKVGLRALVYCIAVFPARYYPADPANTPRIYMALPPLLLAWRDLPAFAAWIFMHALIPFVYPLFLVRYRHEARFMPPEQRQRLMLLSFTGTFLFLGIASAPGWLRLCAVSMPGLILAAWMVSQPNKFAYSVTRFFAGVCVLFVIFGPLKMQRNRVYFQSLPVGRLAWLHERDFDVAEWLRKQTQPSDYFFSGMNRDLYFPLCLRDPAKVPFVLPGAYTRPEQVQNVIDGLEKYSVRYVLWEPRLAQRHPVGDNLQPLREYLSKSYHVAHRFISSDEIWERNSLAQLEMESPTVKLATTGRVHGREGAQGTTPRK